MRILIYKNASSSYHHRCYRHAHPQCGMLHNPEWKAMLKKIEGTWVVVETAHLFDNQFNTAPIPGVSESGLRLMIEDVEMIEDDVRIGLFKCGYCGHSHNRTKECEKCNNGSEYTQPLVDGVRYERPRITTS